MLGPWVFSASRGLTTWTSAPPKRALSDVLDAWRELRVRGKRGRKAERDPRMPSSEWRSRSTAEGYSPGRYHFRRRALQVVKKALADEIRMTDRDSTMPQAVQQSCRRHRCVHPGRINTVKPHILEGTQAGQSEFRTVRDNLALAVRQAQT